MAEFLYFNFIHDLMQQREKSLFFDGPEFMRFAENGPTCEY
jgi:hypothetical protein